MSPPETIAIVSALPEELAPLLRRVAGLRRERVGVLEIARGELSGRPVCLCSAGEGLEQAGVGVRRLLESEAASGLIGVGVGGGLSEELEPEAVVWSRAVHDPEGSELVPSESELLARAEASASARGGTVVTVMNILASSASKQEVATRLGLDGSVVADLESSAWAAAAREHRIPWIVLRAISDGLAESLPLDFERFRDSNGGVSRGRVAAHAATRPRLLFKLNRLRRRVARCAEALADSTEELLA